MGFQVVPALSDVSLFGTPLELYVIESRTPTKKQADSGQTRNDAKDESRMEKKKAAALLIYSPRKPRGAQL